MKKITSGVYILYKDGNPVYVGQSNNILARIGEHIRDGAKDFDEFEYYELDEAERIEIEAFLIRVIRPEYNLIAGHTMNTDKITIQIPKENSNLFRLKEQIELVQFLNKYTSIKQVAEQMGYTIMHLLATLENMNAPILEKDGKYIEKDWIFENYEQLQKKL